jgi:hypothetical protein
MRLRRTLQAVALLSLAGPAQAQLAILDSWEKPPYADSADFKTSVSVRLSKSEPVGYVIRLANDDDMPTGSFTRLYKIVPITITVPSYSGGQTGTFYDGMAPLVSGNLAGTVYIYAEYDGNASAGPQTITLTQTGATVTLNITVVDNTLTPNGKLFYVEMSNVALTYGHYGHYENGSEALGIPYSQMLVDHRVAPMKNWVFEPSITGGLVAYDEGGALSFRNHVLDFYPSEDGFSMWNYTTQTKAEGAEASVTAESQTDVWYYSCDEPAGGGIAACNTIVSNQGTWSPSIKTMVTSWIGSGIVNNDIYCPIIDWFENGGVEAHDTEEADYVGKELWLYTSCQEHNCSTNRNGNPGATKVSGGAPSGMPGLVIDHEASHVYAFIAMPFKYTTVQALLYYNSVENLLLYGDSNGNIDPWIDNFNFGGNGDGTLMYPLRTGEYGSVSDVPAPSIRLKTIRSAEYLMDYVAQASPAQEAACSASALITDTNTWEHDADVWRAFRDCLLDELGFADQGEGTPVLRNPTIRPLDTKVSVTLGMPELLYESNCSAVIKTSPGGTTVETITSTEGLAVRTLQSSVALTASTAYTVTQSCEGADTDAQLYAFTTKATPAGGNRTVSISAGDPPTYPTAARATVRYDDNAALSSPLTEQNTNCGSGCTINLTLAAGLWYYRWEWQTAADAVLGVGAVQALQVE